ncbi:class I SAM-dependent methyltransferase [Brucella gallinifaecis]|uniref:class I SAM-dependent methyltransferase n=1 Tax=Brucella gallinifaecis TaxID=215590 RepID=UPI00236005AE|nr:class I SAM-dependent methyltransferase [Brucella gallinifaecis]
MSSTRNNKDNFYYDERMRKIEKSLEILISSQNELIKIAKQSDEYLRKLSVCAEMYALPRTNKSLFRTASQRAQERSLDIIQTEMRDAVFFEDHDEFRLHALNKAGPGCALEFGVYNGYTLGHMAEHQPDRQFYGFDSFYGLPEEWAGYLEFDFNRDGVPPDMPKNVELIVGTFDQTLPLFSKRELDIAFIHIDCDIYSSTKCIFDNIGHKLKSGCVLVFDEYFNYVGFEEHERKAFNEFLAASGRTIQWFSYSGQQCAGLLL